MASIESWADDALHTLPMVTPRQYGAKQGQAGLTRTIRIGDGTTMQGILMRVTFPDYFERISRRRGGWGSNSWGDIERVLERANLRMADELQLLLAQALEETRVQSRKGASSGALEAALLSPRNRIVTGRRFGVGVISYLNQSQAKYWRQIDSGTNVHVGQVLEGFWISPGGRWHPHDRSRRQDHYMPRAAETIGEDARAGTRAVIREAVIRNPIEPQQYFDRAWKAFNPRGKALSALRGAITEVLGIPMTGVRNSWDATIGVMSR